MPVAPDLDLGSRQARWVVVRAQAGDRAALDRLLRAVQTPLLALVTTFLRNDDAAKDVLQDTLLLIARKLRWLRDPRWFRAWSFRIATREAVRYAKRSSRWVDATEEELDAMLGSRHVSDGAAVSTVLDDPVFDPDLVARVPALIASLTPAAQAVVRMHYIDGLTLVEIAEALEAPVGTIKSRLAYGLAGLRRALAAGSG